MQRGMGALGGGKKKALDERELFATPFYMLGGGAVLVGRTRRIAPGDDRVTGRCVTGG